MDTSDVIALVALLVSGGIAAWAVVVAHRANARADAANGLSKVANEHSDDANTLGREALGKAEEANRIAAESNQIAHESNRIVERIDDRARERHDVIWRPSWNNAGTEWKLFNDGVDTAFSVLLVARIRGVEYIEEAAEVPKGGHIVVEQPDEPSRRAQDAREWRRLLEQSILTTPAGEPDVAYRVFWATAHGSPRMHNESPV